jgi:hypothetical protein
VIYLGTIELGAAMTRLRSDGGIAAIATVPGPNAVVIRDLPESIARSENILRGLDPSIRVVEPHPPLARLRPSDAVVVERSLSFRGDDHKKAMTMARALYGIKDLRLIKPATLVVRDVEPILTALEALLGELGLIAGEPTPSP